MTSFLIDAKKIVKQYPLKSEMVTVLKGVDLQVRHGEFIAVMGPSGSGKSTLMHILGCLDRPTSGTYYLDGNDVSLLSDEKLSGVRAGYIGFVFQTFNLVPALSVLENVELPFLYSQGDGAAAKERCLAALKQVGLSDRLDHRPSELSGGEMQRTAIARAIAVNPKLILADEPTGNLDSKNGKDILGLFHDLNRAGTAIVMITHDAAVAGQAQKQYLLSDGLMEFSHEN